MNEIVEEWVSKAEGDFHTAGRELVAAVFPNYDAVCFHSQQCIEKYLKALLILRGVLPPKTHDLVQLHRLLKTMSEQWSPPAEDLNFLTRAAVDFRYPGEAADHEEAAQALAICSRLREALLDILAGKH